MSALRRIILLIAVYFVGSADAVECLSCPQGELDNCYETCNGTACYFQLDLPLTSASLQRYDCSYNVSVPGCMADIERQEVTCYCTVDSCNYPLSTTTGQRLKRQANGNGENEIDALKRLMGDQRDMLDHFIDVLEANNTDPTVLSKELDKIGGSLYGNTAELLPENAGSQRNQQEQFFKATETSGFGHLTTGGFINYDAEATTVDPPEGAAIAPGAVPQTIQVDDANLTAVDLHDLGPEPAATGPLVDPLPVGNVPEKAFDGVAHVFVNDAPSGPTEGSGSGSGSGVPAVSESGSGSGDSSGPGSGSGTEVDTESVAPLIAATPEQASATSSENLTDCHSSVALDNVTDGVPSARGCVQPVNFDVSGSGVTEPPQGTTAAIDDAAEGASEAGSGLGSASMPPDMTMVDDPSGGGGGGVSGSATSEPPMILDGEGSVTEGPSGSGSGAGGEAGTDDPSSDSGSGSGEASGSGSGTGSEAPSDAGGAAGTEAPPVPDGAVTPGESGSGSGTEAPGGSGSEAPLDPGFGATSVPGSGSGSGGGSASEQPPVDDLLTASSGSGTEMPTDSSSGSDSAVDPGSGSGSGSAVDPGSGSGSAVDPGSGSGSGTETPTDSSSGSGSAVDPGSGNGSGSAVDPGSGSGSAVDPGSGSGSAVDPGSGSGSGTEMPADSSSGSGSAVDPGSGSGSAVDPGSGSGSAVAPGSGSGSGTEMPADSSSGSGSAVDPGSGSGSGSAVDPGSGSGSGTEMPTDSSSGSDSAVDPGSGSGSGGEATAEPGSGVEVTPEGPANNTTAPSNGSDGGKGAIDVLDEMGEAAQNNFGDSESPIVQRILNNFMRQQQAMREQMERLRQMSG